MLNFETLNLKDEILKAIQDMGFTEATPIQEQAIPVALTGQDVIGQAQTGTGKTAAFTIPFLQLLGNEPVVQVLILTPTRELCMQVEKEVKKLSKYLRMKSVAVYGGQDINRQIRELKGRPQVIVATPGRLMDHMNRKTIRLDNLKMIVLDEADEMLNMGFLEDIETILSSCPEERQTMMFSATMKDEIKAIANKFMKEPVLVKVKAQELTVPLIEQQYFEVPEQDKFKLLCRLLDIHNPELAMVFGRTKRRVDELTEALQKLGYQAEGLHGDLTQRHRDIVMNKFRNGQISILVATDVAARGLDVSGVSHVFNFDLPQEIDNYVHRIGRTGRAGKEGLALTFVEPRELPHLKVIEKTIQRKLQRTKLPSAQDSRQKKQDILFGQIVTAIKEGRVLDYQELANDLIQEYGSVDVVAAMLELMAGDNDHEANMDEIRLSAERPIYVKRLKEPRRDNNRGRGGHGKGGRGGNHDGKYKKDGMKKDFAKKDFNKKDVFKKDAGKKDYSNKAGKPKTYSRDGKKSYKKNKSAE
ncbi:MAG: DEAD/DEAH box helicase [Peptococcaceae bacterium]|nr:DEAD/DEAH box helicase [Peptococcaceae bacterium]